MEWVKGLTDRYTNRPTGMIQNQATPSKLTLSVVNLQNLSYQLYIRPVTPV